MSKHTPKTNQEAVDIAIDYLHEEMRMWKEDHDRSDNSEVRELFVVGKAVSMATPLFQASPDLLEACKAVVQYHREHDSGEGELYGLDFVTTCVNAICRAEGRTIPPQPTNAD